MIMSPYSLLTPEEEWELDTLLSNTNRFTDGWDRVEDLLRVTVDESSTFSEFWTALVAQTEDPQHLTFDQAVFFRWFVPYFREQQQKNSQMPPEQRALQPRFHDLLAVISRTAAFAEQKFVTYSYLFLYQTPELWPIMQNLHQIALDGRGYELDWLYLEELNALSRLLQRLPRNLELPKSMLLRTIVHGETQRARFETGYPTIAYRTQNEFLTDHTYMDILIKPQGDIRGLFIGFHARNFKKSRISSMVLLPPSTTLVWDKSELRRDVEDAENVEYFPEDGEVVETEIDSINTWTVRYRVYKALSLHNTQKATNVRNSLF